MNERDLLAERFEAKRAHLRAGYGITDTGTEPIRHQPIWFGPVTAA
jgi:hypothetical protein